MEIYDAWTMPWLQGKITGVSGELLRNHLYSRTNFASLHYTARTMDNSILKKTTLDFLRNLAGNNNRDWFNAHRPQFLEAKSNAEAFFDKLIARMNTHDEIQTPSGKKSLYWIHNDVRFSKDKSPYNPRFAGYLRRSKPLLRGGYYVWIKPGGSLVGCGFSYPNADDLKRIRHDISNNYESWRQILKGKTLKSTFGSMQGEQVKTAPRGFSKDHNAIDLLRFKQYWFEHSFKDKEVLAKDFVSQISKTFRAIRPFFDYMSEVLTTDLNGESLYP